jgi:hypothetical protein
MTIAMAVQQEDLLTLRDVLADIPRDIEAILVYLMFAGFIYIIWWGSRSKGDRGGTAPPPDAGKPAPRSQSRPDRAER